MEIAGRDELNLALFPSCMLDSVQSKSVTYRRDARSLTISAPSDGRLPSILDEEILLALLTLSTDRSFRVSPRDLRTILGMSNQGYYGERIREGVDVWTRTSFQFEGAWFDKTTGRTTDRTFHILDESKIIRSDRGVDYYELRWSDAVFDSLRAGHVFPFDFGIYRKLHSPVAKRLFRVISRQVHIHALAQVHDVKSLAYELVGMSPTAYKDSAQLKRKLKGPLRQLESAGFLVAIDDVGRFRKTPGGSWEIFIQVDDGSGRSHPPAPSLEYEDVMDEYLKQGVARHVLAKLVETHTPDYMKEKLEILKGSKKPTKNAAGFLVDACRENYQSSRKEIDDKPAKPTIVLTAPRTERKEIPFEGMDDQEREAAYKEIETLYAKELEDVQKHVKRWPIFAKAAYLDKMWELWKIHRQGKNATYTGKG